jgi:hypothetical protein
VTPQERIALAARILDEGLPGLDDEPSSDYDSLEQCQVEVLRWLSVAMSAQAHVAVATAQLNASPETRSRRMPCPAQHIHDGHLWSHVTEGWVWCPGVND